MTYAEKLKDPRWQKKRLEILSRDKFTCKKCKDTQNTLHVHHLTYARHLEPWDIPSDFLTTLCGNCHEKEKGIPGFKMLNLYLKARGFLEEDALELAGVLLSIAKEDKPEETIALIKGKCPKSWERDEDNDGSY